MGEQVSTFNSDNKTETPARPGDTTVDTWLPLFHLFSFFSSPFLRLFKLLSKFLNFFYLLACFGFFPHFYFLCFMVVPLYHCLCAYLSFSEIIVLIWMFFFLLLLILYSVLLLLSLFSHLSMSTFVRRRVKLVVIFLSTFTFILFGRQKDPPLLWCVMCKAPGACLLPLHLSLSLSLSTLIHTHTHTLPFSFFRMSAFHWSRMKIGQQLQQPSTYETLEPNQKDFKYLCIYY